MHARAAALNMNELIGFNGCTHWLLTGCRVGPSLLFRATPRYGFEMQRVSFDNLRNQKSDKKTIVGNIDCSPLNKIFFFSDDDPVDTMHKVILSTARTLRELFSKSLKPKHRKVFDCLLEKFQTPVELMHNPMN